MKNYKKMKYLTTVVMAFVLVMFFNTMTVHAANLKTKTFTINNLGSYTSIQLIGVKDSTGEVRYETASGWQHGGSISISINGSTATIVMSSCDVTSWTPYLQITTSKTGYNPTGWLTGTLGGNGMNYGTIEVHNLTDTWSNGSCLFYIGLGYSYNDVYATWSPWKHTITYNANGGSGAPGNQTKTYGVGLNLSSKQPTRTGYTFGGWKCSKGGTYQPGEAYTKDYNGGTVTMTAIWNPWQHTIVYDANGGSRAPGNQIKTYGVSMSLSGTTPTRTGYTFKGWTCSIGGTYQPGQTYSHDQNGGTVMMKANWKDETAPSCSNFSATPNQWSAGNGTVTFSAQDQGAGISSIILERYSYISRTWSTVKTWSYSGTTSVVSGSYTETSEGVFYYKLTIKDKEGNTTTKTSAIIYLDHSNPVLSGVQNTVTDWTNVAPVINAFSTDYLSGTTYAGSGLVSVVIKDDSGNVVASGTAVASYTLAAKYEGIHTWDITATDKVGHTSSMSVITKYDITAPGMDGTEITHVVNGVTYSGYCQDNIISQHIDDETSRSPNNPNVSSGVRSVILYRVTGTNKEVIYSDQTKAVFTASDTHSYFDMYYEITADEKKVSYYEVIVTDFAGNRTTKKLTSQYSLLSWFHTSIDRSTYE